jgi:hypothetical protein
MVRAYAGTWQTHHEFPFTCNINSSKRVSAQEIIFKDYVLKRISNLEALPNVQVGQCVVYMTLHFTNLSSLEPFQLHKFIREKGKKHHKPGNCSGKERKVS